MPVIDVGIGLAITTADTPLLGSGELELNPSLRLAYYRRRRHDRQLSRGENSILAVVLERPGVTVSDDILLARSPSIRTMRSLHVYASRVRGVLRALEAPHELRRESGGYVLVPP